MASIASRSDIAPARRVIAARLLSPDALLPLAERWADLARNAIEPNPFFAPWMLAPALAAYHRDDLEIACLFEGSPDGRLVALAPFETVRRFGRLPVVCRRIWRHPHCFFGAPLVRRGWEEDAAFRLMEMMDDAAGDAALVLFDRMDANGPIARALLRGNRAWVADQHQRAMLALGPGGYASAEAYLADAVNKKRRKEQNRLAARLAEQGAIAFERLEIQEDLPLWRRQFLHLESAGWKGEEKTALNSTEADAAFFNTMAEGALTAGALDFYRLTLDGRPIAMLVNLTANGAGYGFKICYDEDFARYSPGVMIIRKVMEDVWTRGDLTFIDSCASADHPMINNLWTDRRHIIDIAIQRRGSLSGAAARLFDRARARPRNDQKKDRHVAD